MKYLVDTSALVRIIRRQAEPEWYDAVDRGLIALCEPVLVETLTGVDAKNFGRAEDDLRNAYPWVPVPDNAWTVVASVQRDLAKRSQHQGLSVADHLVVATGIQLKLIVLHEDADFETVSHRHPSVAPGAAQRASVTASYSPGAP